CARAYGSSSRWYFDVW
nr:immunoglobulin heavy chain junction region [Mus musculus]